MLLAHGLFVGTLLVAAVAWKLAHAQRWDAATWCVDAFALCLCAACLAINLVCERFGITPDFDGEDC
jgi:hypothetical protein